MYSKGEVIDYLWQYSKYYGDLLGFCDIISDEVNPHSALINLFNITEMVFKSKVDNYDINFYSSIEKLEKEGYLTKIESNFLNDKENGIRGYRNKFAHANLIRYSLIFEDDPGVVYPITEYSTCEKLYNIISPILYNLILKVAFNHLYSNHDITLDNEIDKIKIDIKEISPEEILRGKGMEDLINTSEWSQMPESTRYRLAEDSGDVYVYCSIFKELFKDKIVK
ncbi:hypothetical protein [Clostridium sp.]|uniref:hypothetical protein n=1 Tax=Clostridium sp. TaxID=1506 RepID=UPI0025BCD9E6|nr:hypothetical protein [Clostridium sp.]